LHRTATCCNTAPPLQRSTTCCNARATCCIPAQPRLAAAAKPTPSAAAAASAPLKAATGRNPQPNPSERCDGGRSASSAGYSRLRHYSRGGHSCLSSAQCVCTCGCAAQRGLVRLTLISRFCILGLRSSLTTGLGSYPPTSAPGPSPPPPTSAPGLSPSPTHISTAKESILSPRLL
jgi:hypothetical protein